MKTFKILLADDNEQIIELVSIELAQFLKHVQITTVRDGLKARDLTNKYRYDLIVSDNVMPGLEGRDFIRQVRDTPGPNSDTPFIICSGNFHVGDFKGISECCVLHKPFDQEKLHHYLRRLLSLDPLSFAS